MDKKFEVKKLVLKKVEPKVSEPVEESDIETKTEQLKSQIASLKHQIYEKVKEFDPEIAREDLLPSKFGYAYEYLKIGKEKPKYDAPLDDQINWLNHYLNNPDVLIRAYTEWGNREKIAERAEQKYDQFKKECGLLGVYLWGAEIQVSQFDDYEKLPQSLLSENHDFKIILRSFISQLSDLRSFALASHYIDGLVDESRNFLPSGQVEIENIFKTSLDSKELSGSENFLDSLPDEPSAYIKKIKSDNMFDRGFEPTDHNTPIQEIRNTRLSPKFTADHVKKILYVDIGKYGTSTKKSYVQDSASYGGETWSSGGGSMQKQTTIHSDLFDRLEVKGGYSLPKFEGQSLKLSVKKRSFTEGIIVLVDENEKVVSMWNDSLKRWSSHEEIKEIKNIQDEKNKYIRDRYLTPTTEMIEMAQRQGISLL